MATHKEKVLGLKRKYGYELWEPMLKEKFKDIDGHEGRRDRFANTRGSYWGGRVIDGKIVG